MQSPTLIEAYNRHNTLSQQGQYSEAIPYAREALRLGEEEFGPDHPATAIFLNNLALLYKAQGNYAEQGLNLKDQGKCLRDAERISWRWSAFAICQMANNRMSLVGTKREFISEHFQVGKPTHCRPPSPSVGLLPDGRPDSEGSGARAFDPKPKFATRRTRT